MSLLVFLGLALSLKQINLDLMVKIQWSNDPNGHSLAQWIFFSKILMWFDKYSHTWQCVRETDTVQIIRNECTNKDNPWEVHWVSSWCPRPLTSPIPSHAALTLSIAGWGVTVAISGRVYPIGSRDRWAADETQVNKWLCYLWESYIPSLFIDRALAMWGFFT